MICLKATLPINNEFHHYYSIILPSKRRFHVQRRRRQSVITLTKIIKFSVSSSSSSSSLLKKKKMELSSCSSSSSSSSVLLTSGASGRVNALLSLRVLKSLVMLINAFVLLLFFPFQRRRSISSSSTTTTLASSTEKSSKDEKQDIGSSNRKSSSPVVRVPAAMVPSRRSSLTVVEQDVITRRALAIKRVTQDSDDDNDHDNNNNNDESIREISLFITSRGDTLFTQSWTPVSMKTRGLVVLLHGLNEHSGRYNKFAKQLNSSGYKVYAMDWIGHGGSDGLHAYVHSLDYAVTDMKEFVEKVLVENPGFPCFCFGHSTGAAIVLKAVLDPKFETLVQGVVVTSPAVGVQASHPIVGMLAPVFSLLLPKYQFSNAYKKGLPVSRDPAALVAKYSDPLVYTGSVRMRTGSEVLRISSYLQKNLSRFTVPFFVLHGTADTVTDPEASVKLYEEASSTDKSLKLYEGYLHDLLFEPERDDITKEIINWLDSRT